jgi:hypothetical protein
MPTSFILAAGNHLGYVMRLRYAQDVFRSHASSPSSLFKGDLHAARLDFEHIRKYGTIWRPFFKKNFGYSDFRLPFDDEEDSMSNHSED